MPSPAVSIRTRFRAAHALLVAIVLAVAFATEQALDYRRPGPLAPQAVSLVRQYLEALRAGDQAEACRIFPVPSLCSAGAVAAVQRFTVSAAEPAVDGVVVPATIDDEQALFQLASRHGLYRIVDVVADPGAPAAGS